MVILTISSVNCKQIQRFLEDVEKFYYKKIKSRLFISLEVRENKISFTLEEIKTLFEISLDVKGVFMDASIETFLSENVIPETENYALKIDISIAEIREILSIVTSRNEKTVFIQLKPAATFINIKIFTKEKFCVENTIAAQAFTLRNFNRERKNYIKLNQEKFAQFLKSASNIANATIVIQCVEKIINMYFTDRVWLCLCFLEIEESCVNEAPNFFMIPLLDFITYAQVIKNIEALSFDQEGLILMGSNILIRHNEYMATTSNPDQIFESINMLINATNNKIVVLQSMIEQMLKILQSVKNYQDMTLAADGQDHIILSLQETKKPTIITKYQVNEVPNDLKVKLKVNYALHTFSMLKKIGRDVTISYSTNNNIMFFQIKDDNNTLQYIILLTYIN